MFRRGLGGTTLILAALLAAAPDDAGAQERRRAGPPPDGAPLPAPASLPRMPFVGLWEGAMTLRGGPGAHQPMPLRMAFDVADTATRAYTGATIHPGNGRAPHLNTVASDGRMQWKQQNSGGGFWVYSARLVARDSIEGTVVLRDWPQLPAGESAPAGTFTLVRRSTAAPGKT